MEFVLAIGVISLILWVGALLSRNKEKSAFTVVPYYKDKYVLYFVISGNVLLGLNLLSFIAGVKYLTIGKILFIPCFLSILLAGLSVSVFSYAPSHLGLVLILAVIYQTIIFGLLGRLIGSFFKH